MFNVKNRKCINNISRKSMAANKQRNVILIIAIALTTVMMTTLFMIGGSIMKSMEESMMYQVGTVNHAGFKFLTKEEYELLSQDPEVHDLSYNIIVGDVLSEELSQDYTEVRFTTEGAARSGFSMPETGRLPEKVDEIATCTEVLDIFGKPHELGEIIHLEIGNGFSEYEGDFRLCGYWEKPASTLTNQIYVSREFQEEFSPAWENQEDKDRFTRVNSFAGSINPGFNFKGAFDISSQMEELKKRLGWNEEINDGVNWAYAASSIDPTAVALLIILLVMIIASVYLIIYNIFYIAVSSDVRYYVLLKTIGMTNKQLRRIIVGQAARLSMIAIPAGILLGYLTSIVFLPFITGSFLSIPCRIHPDLRIFAVSAVFSWLVVRMSCIKPCKIIKKISPVDAVRYSEYTGRGLSCRKKTRKVSVMSLAWENLKRSRHKTIVVILSLAISIIMINVTVSIISSFDKNAYIKQYAVTDFMVTDGSMLSKNYQDMDYEGVTASDIEAFKKIDGITETGAIYMSESLHSMEGTALERMTQTYEDHAGWFTFSPDHQKAIEHLIYDTHKIDSHIYGVDEFTLKNMEIDQGEPGWEQFRTGKYVIVSSPLESGNDRNDAKYAFYQIGEKVKVDFPDGTKDEYEVVAIGDLPYAMGPEHGHGLDVYFMIPEKEYLQHIPESKGAMKLFFNADETRLDAVEEAVSEYCEFTSPQLGYTSRMTYLKDFNNLINTFLFVGGALSLILALIGVLNLINLSFTSINERKNELEVLRAVGMTKKQMVRMLIGEGILRICLTFTFVLTIGLLLNYLIVNLAAGQMMMFNYKFVIWPIITCIPVFSVISVAVSKITIEHSLKM